MTTNPLLEISPDRPDIPFDRIRAEHVVPGVDQLLTEARARIDLIATSDGARTYDSTLGALERATERLDHAMAVVSHLEGVLTTPELREAYNEVRPRVSELYSSIPLNPGLWRALKEFAATDEAAKLDPTRRRLLDKTIDEFRRHGADLDDAGKRRLAEIDVELTKATTKFSQNVLDASNAWELVVNDEAQLAGLPPSAIDAARERARAKGLEGHRFTLQEPSLIAVLTYLDDRSIREQVWRAYNTRATSGTFDNRALIARVLELRREKASLLGYGDFADLVLADRMAKTGARARDFVQDLHGRTEPFAAREHEELRTFQRKELGDRAYDLMPWDVGYWAEKQRKALYDFDEEELRPYFALDRVLEGMFEVVHRLYGVRVEPRKAPVWHESVRTFGVRDENGALIATFYVDVFPRESKKGGAWMNGVMVGELRGDERTPHVGLFCANATPPVGDRPALLTHREVETLFHEFGHLLHHMLTKVPVRSLAGTHVAWDFVELPSQIMENWCWEREALDLFARHWQTGEAIPQPLFDKLTRAKNYRAASAMMRQLSFAATDLALHTQYDPARDGDVLAYARDVMQRYTPVPLPPDYGMLAGFMHLFASPVAYAAGYYSYKWAEVLDADAFSRFKQEGIFSRDVGRAFRDEILACGDSRDPMDLFKSFMGREPRLEALFERSGLVSGG